MLWLFAEGLDVSQVPLRPRGRPPRVLSDIIAQLAHSQVHGQMPGMALAQDHAAHMSLSQVVHHQLQSAQLEQLTSNGNVVTVATTPAQEKQQDVTASDQQQCVVETAEVVVNGNDHQVATGQQAQQQEQTTTTTTSAEGVSVSERSPSLDTPDPSEDQNLSLSVELAAVNQAILSLTGQQPISVKLEKAEKEKHQSWSGRERRLK